jgi:hypothetical protein
MDPHRLGDLPAIFISIDRVVAPESLPLPALALSAFLVSRARSRRK